MLAINKLSPLGLFEHAHTMGTKGMSSNPHPPDCPTCEEQNSLQLLVVEEIVEGPQSSFFSVWIRVQIRIVTR